MSKRAAGGTFGKDPTTEYESMLKVVVGETVLLDRYLVDDCRTKQKIRESIVDVKPSVEKDAEEQPLHVDVVYRRWDNTVATAPKRSVHYELKDGVYVRGKEAKVKKVE